MVELKAKVDQVDLVREKLINLKAQRIGTFHQTDIYFDVPKGRLKLRKTDDRDEVELVYYEREDVANIKESHVFRLKIQNSVQLEHLLKKVLTTKIVVEKLREIYCYQGTQIHLDIVERLGTFVEFEIKTSPLSNDWRASRHFLEKLMQELGIDSEKIEKLSYSDLVERWRTGQT